MNDYFAYNILLAILTGAGISLFLVCGLRYRNSTILIALAIPALLAGGLLVRAICAA